MINSSKDPVTLKYTDTYKVTEKFMKDLHSALDDMAYCDAKKYYDEIEVRGGVFPIGPLNEFIRKLGMLPYKYVKNVMSGIKNDFKSYFTKVQ